MREASITTEFGAPLVEGGGADAMLTAELRGQVNQTQPA